MYGSTCTRSLACLLAGLASAACAAQERANFFDDPFVQATHGIAACPVPDGPLITRQEMLEQSHGRAERGTSCYQAGKCRLPNAYMYDADIVARARKAVRAAPEFADSSVWIEGRRRWVWLKGCVRSQAQADALVHLVGEIDDVQRVFGELTVLAH